MKTSYVLPNWERTFLLTTAQLWRTIFQTQTLNLELDKVSEAWRELHLISIDTLHN